MKQNYLLLCFTLLPLASFAQNRIEYSYDAAGNRIKREIVISATRAMAKEQAVDSLNLYSDKLNEHAVKIYPNPTRGALRVSISGLRSADECQIGVYSTHGAQIMLTAVNTDNVDIDISNQPTGIYLLKITINKKSTTWKIIKK